MTESSENLSTILMNNVKNYRAWIVTYIKSIIELNRHELIALSMKGETEYQIALKPSIEYEKLVIALDEMSFKYEGLTLDIEYDKNGPVLKMCLPKFDN